MQWTQTCRQKCLLRKHPLLCIYLFLFLQNISAPYVSEVVGIHGELMMPKATACNIFLENATGGVGSECLCACAAVSALPSCETGEEKNPSKFGHLDLQAYKLCPSLHTCSCTTALCLGNETTGDGLCHWIQNGFALICSLLCSSVKDKSLHRVCVISYPKAG